MRTIAVAPGTCLLAVALLGAMLASSASAQGDLPSGTDPRANANAKAQADPGRNRGYALVLAPARQVQAVLTIQVEMPRLSAREWVVYGAEMPVLSCQTGVSSALEPDGEPGRELSPQHRPILRARIPADTAARRTGLDLRLEYRATLWSRRLVRVRAGQGAGPGQGTPAPPLLEAGERQAALASGNPFDFTSDAFRRWLDDHGLRRGPEEGEIDYARRAFLAIKGGFTYTFTDKLDRQASHICRAGESDCGGLAIVFVSALRAAGIPARVLVGRWAMSGGMEGGKVYNQEHAKAEFYASGIGWVPADLSSGVLHDKSAEGLAYFGYDPGDFLVMHLDTNLICDSVIFGRKTVEWLQTPVYWVTGSGSFDQAVTRQSWTVKTSPLPELVEATLKKSAPSASKPKRGRARSVPPRR